MIHRTTPIRIVFALYCLTLSTSGWLRLRWQCILQVLLEQPMEVHRIRILFPGGTMPLIRQNAGIRKPIITAFLNVFSWESVREADISEASSMAGVSGSVCYAPVQATEESVSAFLKGCRATWIRWFETEIEARCNAAGAGLEVIADVLEEGFEDRKRFGLAFCNIDAEVEASNSEAVIAAEQKEHLRCLLERLAVRIRLEHPDIAASAAVLVIERTIAWAQMTGSLTETQNARLLFQCLNHS